MPSGSETGGMKGSGLEVVPWMVSFPLVPLCNQIASPFIVLKTLMGSNFFKKNPFKYGETTNLIKFHKISLK